MTNPNPGPAESVTPARSVSPATSVAGVPATDLPYIAPSQLVRSDAPALPDDHPQVRAAAAPPPPKEAYERASADPKERAATWHKNREARRNAKKS